MTRHHTKLYAPEDYKHEGHFVYLATTPSPDEDLAAVNENVDEIIQKTGISPGDKNSQSNTSDIRKLLFAMRSLAIRHIQDEFEAPIMSPAKISKELIFDGYFSLEGRGYGVFIRPIINDAPGDIISEAFISKLKYISNEIDRLNVSDFHILIAIIFYNTEVNKKIKRDVKSALKRVQSTVSKDVIFLEYEELEEEYQGEPMPK